MIAFFIYALLPTLGFCIIFHVPKKSIIPTSIIGGLGWVAFKLVLLSPTSDKIFACFLAALVVGLLSDICSRVFKEAATIFTIPGIMPLVPGAGMYYTMLALTKGDFSEAAQLGTETMFMAGAIALGLIVIGSVIRIITQLKRGIQNPGRISFKK